MNHNTIEPGTKLSFRFDPSALACIRNILNMRNKNFLSVNPLSPKSDQHEFSLYNINALENRVVMRLEYMIREDVSN